MEGSKTPPLSILAPFQNWENLERRKFYMNWTKLSLMVLSYYEDIINNKLFYFLSYFLVNQTKCSSPLLPFFEQNR